MNLHGIERAPDEHINWKTSIPFLLIHALVLLTFVTGITPTAAIIFAVMFWGRMFFITAGYHRYFRLSWYLEMLPSPNIHTLDALADRFFAF